MKRARLVVLAGIAACLALGWSIDGAFAQKGKPSPKPAATAKPAPAPKPPPATPKGKKDAGVAAIETSAPPPATVGGKDAGVEKGGPTAERTLDGGAKVFRFGELEVEGRLRSPQLVYFLRRVRAEFAAGDLGHRSFMLELSQTRQSDNF